MILNKTLVVNKSDYTAFADASHRKTENDINKNLITSRYVPRNK